WQLEHEMRSPDTDQCSHELGSNIVQGVRPGNLATKTEGECYSGVEVGAGNWAEDQDQHDQDGAGRKRIAKQCERNIATCKLGTHDPGADHGREQEGGAQRLRKQPLRPRGSRHVSVPLQAWTLCLPSGRSPAIWRGAPGD